MQRRTELLQRPEDRHGNLYLQGLQHIKLLEQLRQPLLQNLYDALLISNTALVPRGSGCLPLHLLSAAGRARLPDPRGPSWFWDWFARCPAK